MWEKYLNQTVVCFFLQNLPTTKFLFNFKSVTHRIQLTLKFSFVRYVFVEFSGLLVDPKDPRMTPKIESFQKLPIFYVLMQFLSIFR